MIIYWQGNWLLCSNTLSPHTGLLPPVWCDAILCAVFKKGDPSVYLIYDNYRGIAVGALMGKIYSMMTPTSWKHSTTILLYKNKGTITSLKYYRQIGLENTIYKLWTRMVTIALTDFGERNQIHTVQCKNLDFTGNFCSNWQSKPTSHLLFWSVQPN
jgi:hypothetical protein